MKTLVLWSVVSALAYAGFALAQPPAHDAGTSAMHRMMMGDDRGEGMSGKGGMTGMMERMNAMMDECAAMMRNHREQKQQSGQDS